MKIKILLFFIFLSVQLLGISQYYKKGETGTSLFYSGYKTKESKGYSASIIHTFKSKLSFGINPAVILNKPKYAYWYEVKQPDEIFHSLSFLGEYSVFRQKDAFINILSSYSMVLNSGPVVKSFAYGAEFSVKKLLPASNFFPEFTLIHSISKKSMNVFSMIFGISYVIEIRNTKSILLNINFVKNDVIPNQFSFSIGLILKKK